MKNTEYEETILFIGDMESPKLLKNKVLKFLNKRNKQFLCRGAASTVEMLIRRSKI